MTRAAADPAPDTVIAVHGLTNSFGGRKVVDVVIAE